MCVVLIAVSRPTNLVIVVVAIRLLACFLARLLARSLDACRLLVRNKQKKQKKKEGYQPLDSFIRLAYSCFDQSNHSLLLNYILFVYLPYSIFTCTSFANIATRSRAVTYLLGSSPWSRYLLQIISSSRIGSLLSFSFRGNRTWPRSNHPSVYHHLPRVATNRCRQVSFLPHQALLPPNTSSRTRPWGRTTYSQ